MAIDQIGEHSDPPADFDGRELPILQFSQELYRIHQTDTPYLFYGNTRKYRFDAPNKEYEIMYTSTSAPGAFIETLGTQIRYRYISDESLRARDITLIPTKDSLWLVDLSSPNLANIGADARIFTGDFYNVSRRWALAIFRHSKQVDGLYYPARRDINRRSIALFKRADSKLDHRRSETSNLGNWSNPLRSEILLAYDLRTI